MKAYRSDNIRQFFVDEKDARTFPIGSVITFRGVGGFDTFRKTEVDNIDGLVALIAQAERHDG